MPQIESPLSLHQIRKRNLILLIAEFTAERLAQGETAKGAEPLFATHVGISRVSLCHFKSQSNGRNISDSIATQIECRTGKDKGWLDVSHAHALPSEAQRIFMELAVQAWQQGNAKNRRRLMLLARQGFGIENRKSS